MEGGAQKMSKRNIIFICIAIAVVIIIAFIIYFIVINNNDNSDSEQNIYNTEKVIITKYDDNLEVEQTVEITKNSKIRELKEICDNVSLEQDDITSQLVIKKDIKVDLNNGTFFMIQSDLEDYCYIENSNSNLSLTIKMPEGLFSYVNTILQENV